MKTYFMEYLHFNAKLTTILLAGFLTFLKQFVAENVFDDIQFLTGISLMILIDAISGTAKALVQKTFSFPLLFKKTIIKCTSYVLFIGGTSVLIKLKVGGNQAGWVQWIDDYLYMGVGLAEFWSIVQNVDVINPGLFPDYLKKFIKDGAEKGEFVKPTQI
jgi:hypothetical protein